DIGAGSGTTALSVFAELPPGQVHVYTYDVDQANLDWAALAVANEGRSADWTPMLIRDGAVTSIAPSLVLIDGDHSYDAVWRDIGYWTDLVIDPYLIWFHDYHVAANEPGSRRAIDESIEAGHLDVIETAGLGIACRVKK